MGKNPAFQIYPGDWRRSVDVQKATMETRGVWIEMLMCMWDATERGKLEGTASELARLLGCDEHVLNRALVEIKRLKIGDVTNCNNDITVINRRMYREYLQKENTRLRVEKHRKKKKCNGPVTGCTEDEVEEEEIKGESEGEKRDVLTERFDAFWKAYPKKTAKAYCLKIWKKLKPTQDLLTKMLDTLEKQKVSDGWTKDGGQYIPNPSTWLNQGRWDDEVDSVVDSMPIKGFSL